MPYRGQIPVTPSIPRSTQKYWERMGSGSSQGTAAISPRNFRPASLPMTEALRRRSSNKRSAAVPSDAGGRSFPLAVAGVGSGCRSGEAGRRGEPCPERPGLTGSAAGSRSVAALALSDGTVLSRSAVSPTRTQSCFSCPSSATPSISKHKRASCRRRVRPASLPRNSVTLLARGPPDTRSSKESSQELTSWTHVMSNEGRGQGSRQHKAVRRPKAVRQLGTRLKTASVSESDARPRTQVTGKPTQPATPPTW